MKAIAVFVILCTLSFSAFGSDKADKKLAVEYLKVARYEQMINTTLDTYSQQMFKNSPEADRVEMDKLMREVMGWEATKDQLADLIIGLYTKAELKAAITFMKTPLGASHTLKGDLFSNQFATLVSNNILRFIREHPIQPNPTVNPDATR